MTSDSESVCIGILEEADISSSCWYRGNQPIRLSAVGSGSCSNWPSGGSPATVTSQPSASEAALPIGFPHRGRSLSIPLVSPCELIQHQQSKGLYRDVMLYCQSYQYVHVSILFGSSLETFVELQIVIVRPLLPQPEEHGPLMRKA